MGYEDTRNLVAFMERIEAGEVCMPDGPSHTLRRMISGGYAYPPDQHGVPALTPAGRAWLQQEKRELAEASERMQLYYEQRRSPGDA